jgi:hypothetical protein
MGHDTMKILKVVLSIAALGLVGVAIAGDNAKTRIAIELSDDGADEDVRIMFDSDDAGFNLHDMQVGENRSIVDESGKTVLVTRQEAGFTFDVDGKTIEMPNLGGEHHKAMWQSDSAEHDVDVHVMRDASFVSAEHMGGVMIMSGKPIDEATQEAIRSLLESAGHGSDVNFIDHEQHSGQQHGAGLHQVKVIRKTVETTQ